MSKKKKGGEDGSGGECNDERSSGRRRGGRDEPSGKEGGKEEVRWRERRGRDYHRREKEHVHAHTCVCIHARRETRPIVIAIPTGEMFLQCAVSCRPATKPERTHPLVPATEQQVAQPSTCPLVCRPPYMPYIYTAAYTLCTNGQRKRRKKERRGKRERRG